MVRCRQLRGRCQPGTVVFPRKLALVPRHVDTVLPAEPGSDCVFTGCSIWIHFPLRLFASSPSSTNSSAHFLSPPSHDFTPSLFAPLAPTVPRCSFHQIFCNVPSLIFCIFYFIQLKYQFCTSSIQVKGFFFVCSFFKILFLYIFLYHSGLIKYLHFTVQMFSGNVLFFFLPAFKRVHGSYLINIPCLVAGGLCASNLSVLLYLWPFVAVTSVVLMHATLSCREPVNAKPCLDMRQLFLDLLRWQTSARCHLLTRHFPF